MKTLFYNPIELPAEVHIVSECFGIDITYEPMGDPDHPAWMSELFNLAIPCETVGLIKEQTEKARSIPYNQENPFVENIELVIKGDKKYYLLKE